MALTERKIIDLIEVLEKGYLQIREANIIERDGAIVAKTFHRYVLTPGDDVSEKEQRIKDIASVVWTPEILANFSSSLAQETTNNLSSSLNE
jgi:hypothetical protein